MLVIDTEVGGRVFVGDNVVVKVLRKSGRQVRLGFDAPKAIKILRAELVEGVENEKKQ